MEKQFKLDIHVHTSETSSCGQVSAQEAVRLYEQAGYDGIIITDHYHLSLIHISEPTRH